MSDFNLPAGAEFWREPTVCQKTGLARSTMRAAAKAGTFPLPVKIGPNAAAWISVEVENWMRDRVRASRDSAAA